MSTQLNLINNNRWTEAINNSIDIFEEISDGKNIFHFACMRGKFDVIRQIMDLQTDMIYISDNNGNTGAHLLAINSWTDKLIDLVNVYPKFLKLKNDNDDYVYNIIQHDIGTLKSVINCMKINGLAKYLSNFVYFVVDNIQSIDDKYLDILKILHDMKITLPLMHMITTNKHELITHVINSYDNIDINVIDHNKFSLLHASLEYKMRDLSILLINNNINVNASGSENRFIPLITCFKKKLFDVAEEILKRPDLDYNKQDNALNIPVYYLIEHIHKNPQDFKKLKQMLTIMIGNSNLNIVNNVNETPLSYLKRYNLISTLIKPRDDCVEKLVTLPKVYAQKLSYGMFNADYVHNIIYTFYVLNTYDNVVIPMQHNLSDKTKWIKYILSRSYKTDSTLNSFMNSIVFGDIETYNVMTPYLITWVNKNNYYVCENFVTYLSRAINTTKRFVMLKITIIPATTHTHANVVLYDKLANVITRFEPYGDWDISDSFFLNKRILSWFTKSVDTDKRSTIKIKIPSEFLDKTKFQSASFGDNITHKNLGDPGGYCLAWCYWFIELKILNPDINNTILVENALRQILKQTKNDALLTYIRNYAKLLNNEKNKLFKSMKIDNNNTYKVIHNAQTKEAVSNYAETLLRKYY